ncbi:MAG: insulinase family protein, partial [Alistipes sp.]|nr:insulinase family protein [Alistipes sp.]
MKRLFLFVVAVITAASVSAQFNPMQPIEADKDVRVGKLENGLTYYIRHNEKPKGQAHFYILHDVGAIQEDDNQQGLAHFLEHMAFNGTKNLPGKQLINYLESVGVKFGYNLNAGTSWDYTEYQLRDVPTSRQAIVDSALLILHDWSHFIALKPAEIDSERGVIKEELRTRDGASWRSTINMIKTVARGTKYEHRNLIGHLEGLQNFSPSDLESFYRKWYRPELQAVVVVGDIDVDYIENKLTSLMSDIPASPADAAQKEVIVVPNNEAPIVSIFTDPEMNASSVRYIFKRGNLVPKQYANTGYAEMMNIVSMLMTQMGNARLSEIAMKPNAPFTGAGMSNGSFGICPTFESFSVAAQSQDGKLPAAFEAIATEVERIRRHGFTPGEFERAQNNLLRSCERAYNNRNDRKNGEYVEIYLSNFRENTPMPDAKTEWQLDSMIIKNLNVDVINQLASKLITPTNQIVIVNAPEREGLVNPTEAEILSIIQKVAGAEIEPYKDNVVKEPLIAEGVELKGSPVVKTKLNEKLGTTEWTLANGARVIVKPSTLKADEVLMRAYSEGGFSLLSDEDYYTGLFIPTVTSMSGVSKFSRTDLRK